MIYRLSILALLVFLPTPSVAQVSGEDPGAASGAVESASPEDLEAFRAAYARYEDRVREMHDEIKRVVTLRYDEELDRIKSSYDSQSAEKEAEERIQRLEAIAQHEEFIRKYPTSPYTAHRIFRLANLYLDETEYAFAEANAAYRELENEFDRKLEAGEPVAALPEPPGRDYERAITLMQTLIERFPDYDHLGATYYLLGYCYWDELSAQQDDGLAMATYQELVQRLPNSDYAVNGHFALGEIYFNELEFEIAIHHYSKVLEFGQTSHFDRALYKLAWAYYRGDDLGNAIPRFVELIDFSDQQRTEGGKESDMRPEAVRYLAISLVDQADDAERPPITRVEEYFNASGNKPYQYDVMVQVDDVLSQQARYDEELAALIRIQELYPFSPDNPEFQRRIMALHVNKDNPDVEASVAARIELVERFKEGTPWWEANKNNPDALRAASQYIEESLGDVARVYHANAQAQFTAPGEDPARSEYLKAAEAYQDYLDRFPFTSDAYETQYMIAECYFWAADYDTAIAEYDKLRRYPDRTYEGETYVALATSYERLMKEREGNYKDNPLALENFEVDLGAKPETIPDIPISDLRQKYIAAVDTLNGYDPKYKDMAQMQYRVAEIYYFHNKLDEARTRFESIIERYPAEPFAAYAAGYLVNSYHKTGDVQKVFELCEHFLRYPMLGDDEELWATRLETYETKRRNAQFRLAEFSAGTDTREGGRMFEEYYREHGGTENDALALFNAAIWYEKSGDTVKANELYEEFLDEFGEHDDAPSIFFRIAEQYERTMDLDRAIDYYVRVAELHPDYESAPDAYYNAAFLSIGMGKFEDAAGYYLTYVEDFEVDDAPDAYWRAAEAYRDGGLETKALDAYLEYNRRFPDEKIDRTMQSLVHRLKIYEAQGKTRMVTKTEEELLEYFHSIREAGRIGELSKDSVAVVAARAFPTLLARIDEYDALRLPNTQDQDKLKPVLAEKEEMARAISAEATEFLNTYPDFDHIMACLYIMADLYRKFADMIYAYDPPIPAAWRGDEDAEADFTDLIDEIKIDLAEPQEMKAIELFEVVLQRARELKQNSPWVEQARQALHEADPNTYPLIKPDRIQYGDSPYEPPSDPMVRPVEESS